MHQFLPFKTPAFRFVQLGRDYLNCALPKEVALADKTASSEFVRILSALTAQSESSYLVIFAPGGPMVKSVDATIGFNVQGYHVIRES